MDQRVLVLQPTLPSIRDTLRLLALPAGPTQTQRPIVVLNRNGLNGGLTRRDVRLIQGIAPREKKVGSSINLRHVVLNMMTAVGQAIMRSGILPARTLADLEQTLEASGLRGPQGLGVFIGAKLILLIGLPTVAWLVSGDLPIAPASQKLAPLVAGLVGLMAPDRVIAQARTSYIRRLEAGIPDTGARPRSAIERRGRQP